MNEIQKLKEEAKTAGLDKETIDLINDDSYKSVSEALGNLNATERENNTVVRATILDALVPYREKHISAERFYGLLEKEFNPEFRRLEKTRKIAKIEKPSDLEKIVGERVLTKGLVSHTYYMVYEGFVEGKYVFTIQDPEITPKILSFETSSIDCDGGVILDRTKTLVTEYKPGSADYKRKKELLEKNDLWEQKP